VRDYKLKMIGDPNKDKDRLTQSSALTYAAHYRPPVLLIHGNQDVRVPIEQSQEMASALKAAGHDVRLVVIKDEDHTGWLREHYAQAFGEVADFIKTHIAPAVATGAGPQADAASR
jgi:dipeptidyl aminopeptidase/acylaminoacyl peptidase